MTKICYWHHIIQRIGILLSFQNLLTKLCKLCLLGVCSITYIVRNIYNMLELNIIMYSVLQNSKECLLSRLKPFVDKCWLKMILWEPHTLWNHQNMFNLLDILSKVNLFISWWYINCVICRLATWLKMMVCIPCLTDKDNTKVVITVKTITGHHHWHQILSQEFYRLLALFPWYLQWQWRTKEQLKVWLIM